MPSSTQVWLVRWPEGGEPTLLLPAYKTDSVVAAIQKAASIVIELVNFGSNRDTLTATNSIVDGRQGILVYFAGSPWAGFVMGAELEGSASASTRHARVLVTGTGAGADC
jgi:hypothetical protein